MRVGFSVALRVAGVAGIVRKMAFFEVGDTMLSVSKCRIGVIGLGYVGLPLAVEFGKKFATVGLISTRAHP